MSDQTDIKRIADKESEPFKDELTRHIVRSAITASLVQLSTIKDAEIARLEAEAQVLRDSAARRFGIDVPIIHALESAGMGAVGKPNTILAMVLEIVASHGELRAKQLALESQCQRMRDALEELHAQVKGECPSLLNEDSGGDAELDIEIQELLSSPIDLELLSRVIKVLEMSHDRALDWDMLGRAHGNSAVQMWRESADALLKSLSPAP